MFSVDYQDMFRKMENENVESEEDRIPYQINTIVMVKKFLKIMYS